MMGSSEIPVYIFILISTYIYVCVYSKSGSSSLAKVETFCCIKSVLELLLTEVSVVVKY